MSCHLNTGTNTTSCVSNNNNHAPSSDNLSPCLSGNHCSPHPSNNEPIHLSNDNIIPWVSTIVHIGTRDNNDLRRASCRDDYDDHRGAASPCNYDVFRTAD